MSETFYDASNLSISNGFGRNATILFRRIFQKENLLSMLIFKIQPNLHV